MQTLGERIIDARKAKQMTQEQLAGAVGVARNTISSWERNRTKPDMDSARRLSAVLERDFIHDSAAEPESLPEAGPEPEVEPVPEVEAPETTETPPLRSADFTSQKKRRALPWILAGAAVLACLAVGLALHFRAAANAFPVAVYRQQPPDDPDRAFLYFTGSTWDNEIGNNTYLCYDFTLQEQNGQPFSVTDLEVRYENPRGTDKIFVLSADDLRQNGLEPDIPALGSLTLDGGFPKGDFHRVGILVNGTDADGAANTFYGLIEP